VAILKLKATFMPRFTQNSRPKAVIGLGSKKKPVPKEVIGLG